MRSAAGDEELREVGLGVVRRYLSGFRWLFLILGSCAQASHTPDPSREGRLGCCFLLGNEIIIKGCVMVRGGGWDEEFLLLFG